MSIFKKIFKSFSEPPKKEEQEMSYQELENLSLDESFVRQFIDKGGKFLYCTTIDEICSNLQLILKENNFGELLCYDYDLLNVTKRIGVKTTDKFNNEIPFLTSCEHLIANEGDILFSSNQLGSNKLNSFSENFIVYATTSQIAKNTSEGLAGIRVSYQGILPNNISSIKYYTLQKTKENFMNYGNSNAKKLYLLLFEDL